MPSSNIKVFIRVRPSARPSKALTVPPESEGLIVFERDKETPDGQVNNSRTNFKFKFDGILNMKVTQEDVFNIVAKPVIEDVLTGINGTIFAYGQTGSGKTFTITGAAQRYEDRGLIPRTISYLFKAFQRGDASYKLFISYLEIYNNDGFDLLTEEDTARNLEDLPKVQLREDEDGIHLRNLSVNMAQNEEDALNLLFLGDTNRIVAETPMNDASTRSHCMFIIWVDSTVHGTDTVRRAKLHLVDLAGSERISKTGVEGNLQREARYINLSLHHLEQVIVALQERSQGHRTHVPYRNSTMTSVLRDSLGGNCKTVMVGAVAVEESNIDETISTCRFAARVANIKNNAVINEELDPQLLIKRLKKEVSELKDELKLLNGGQDEEEVGEQDVEECRKLCNAYLAEQDPDAPFVCGSVARFRECFRIMREVYWRRSEEADGGGRHPGGNRGSVGGMQSSAAGVRTGAAGADSEVGSLEAMIAQLHQQVAQRDQELGMLVGSLRKQKAPQSDSRVFIKSTTNVVQGVNGHSGIQPQVPPAGVAVTATAPASNPGSSAARSPVAGAPVVVGAGNPATPVQDVDSVALLADRNKAFEVFRKSFRKSETYEENKQAQAKLMAEAKNCGERANAARAAISNKLRCVEKLRKDAALEGTPHGAEDTETLPPDGPEALALLAEIKELKLTYQQNMEKLKQAKEGILGYQKQAEQNKERLQHDFEAWYLSLQRSQGVQLAPDTASFATSLSNAVQGGDPVGGVATRGQLSSQPPPTPSGAPRAAMGADAEPSRSLMSSQASSADSFARVTPARTASPAARSTSSVEKLPPAVPAVGAWEAPRVSSSSSSKGRPPRRQSAAIDDARGPVAVTSGLVQASLPSPSRQHVSPSRRTMSPSPAPASTPKMTGDAQTDSDIAAYYAAFAELQR